MDTFKAMQIIIGCALIIGVLVLADIDAQLARAVARTLYVTNERIHAVIIETKAINHRHLVFQAEQSRFGVAGLGTWSDRAHFDKGKTQSEEGVNVFAILVETGGKTNRVAQGQSLIDLSRPVMQWTRVAYEPKPLLSLEELSGGKPMAPKLMP